MLTRVLQLPANRSVLLLGPRQTGKSTLIRGRLPADAWTVDLLQNEPYLRYSKEPALFRREVEERLRRGVRTIFVDEVQRIPALLDEAHSFIESDQVRFLLTGSSARKLKRGGANLLAGRAAVLPLHPLIVEEHGEHFDLERALRLGALPRVVTSTEEEARDFLRDYVAAYLRMEVEAEALVRNLGGFARFLDVAAAQNGELLNASNVARDAALAERTVREYYKILEDTLVGFRLEAYRKSVRARLVGHSRFYLFDTGVTNAINHRLTAAIDPDTRGRRFEQWLVLECKRRLDYARSEARLFFWRTNNGAEVDLLVEKHGKLVAAVEIKSGKKIDRSDLAGLRSFGLENADVPAFLVTPEAEPHRLEGVLVTNWRDFMAQFATWV
jgi:uncharacterized protein